LPGKSRKNEHQARARGFVISIRNARFLGAAVIPLLPWIDTFYFPYFPCALKVLVFDFSGYEERKGGERERWRVCVG
jgi:hypothetical protein